MEDFVTFEIALKLREKGFMERCLAYYDVDDNTEIEATITTNKGKYILKNQSLENCDIKREIILLFDSYESFIGFLYDFDEEEIILKNHSNHLIGLPIDRCIGWSYTDEPINELNEN